MGPLEGIKIVDLTSVLMGPYATQTLGDYGADVIKVESLDGDITRGIAPARHPDMGPVYLNANRSKRCIALDLKTDAGRDVVLRLAAKADVLTCNIRPAAMRRLKLDYQSVAAANPSIIYASLCGFGSNGPYADKPAYDDLLQGASGLAYLLGRAGDGTPRYVPSAMADRVVGLSAVNAILAALLYRARTSKGQQVEIPMFETMAAFVLGDHLMGLTFEPPLDRGGYVRHLAPDRRPYRTSDGYICVIVYNDKQWSNFFTATGREDLRRDPRFKSFPERLKHIDVVYGELSRILETRSTADWLSILEKADIPAMPMHDLESILADPHLVATNYFTIEEHPTEGPIRNMAVAPRWSASPTELGRLAPGHGEHTREILTEAGYSDAEITRLHNDGVALSAPSRD